MTNAGNQAGPATAELERKALVLLAEMAGPRVGELADCIKALASINVLLGELRPETASIEMRPESWAIVSSDTPAPRRLERLSASLDGAHIESAQLGTLNLLLTRGPLAAQAFVYGPILLEPRVQVPGLAVQVALFNPQKKRVAHVEVTWWARYAGSEVPR